MSMIRDIVIHKTGEILEMKCKIPQKQLVAALKVIKNSKALGKIDKDEEICIRILFDKKENKVEFIASNIGVWVCSSVSISNFIKSKTPDEIFGVEEEGEIFLEAREFISLMETFPPDAILQMAVEMKKSVNNFTVSIIKSEKKGKKKSISLLSVIKPKFFDTSPPDEKRDRISIDGAALIEAVGSVEFASEADPSRQHLWGVQVEIFGNNDIAACTTDTYRICWFDKEGNVRSDNPTVVTPVKSSLVSALKSLDPKKTIHIDIGEKYSVVSQDDQWHGIPNAIQMGDDAMPDWRSIAGSLNKRCRKTVDVPRKALLDCLKTATLTSGGRSGLRICFNSKEGHVLISVDSIEDNCEIRSYMSETEPLDADCFNGDIEDSVTFRAEHLKEIVGKFKSDSIRFHIQGTDQAVMITDLNSDVEYISSVIRGL